jgi:DNA polymerase-3 subunit delta'
VIAFLQRWTYDLLSVSATGKVRYNADYAKDLARIAPSLQATETVRYHRMLLAQQRMIHHPLNARLLIEQLLLAYQALLRGQALPPI